MQKTKLADMSSHKKKHTIESVGMQESDEDLSEDDESDEGEQISAGNEVNLNFFLISPDYRKLRFF